MGRKTDALEILLGIILGIISFILSVTQFLVTVIAIIQALILCIFLLYGSIFVLYLTHALETVSGSWQVKILDIIVGTDMSKVIDDISGFFKVIVIGTLLAAFIISVLLCKGLCEAKPWYVLVYIICGGIAFGFRVSLMRTDEFFNFDDNGFRFVGNYGLFLFASFIVFLRIKLKQKLKQENKTDSTIYAML